MSDVDENSDSERPTSPISRNSRDNVDDEPVDDDEDDEVADEDSEDVSDLSIEQRYDRERQKLRVAKKTITQLLGNIQEYKRVLEAEKDELRTQFLSEIDRLEQEKLELTELCQEQQAALDETEEEKQRRNKENMENLQTLLKEMSIIEEANDQMGKELDTEKQKHDLTKEQLETSTQIIQQLEIKMEMMEKQMSKMQQLNSQASKSEQLDPKIVEELKLMQEDGIRGEVLKLRKQLTEEKNKREKIDNFLSQARKISSEGFEKQEGTGASGSASQEIRDQLEEAKSNHEKTRKMLEEERQNVLSYKQQVEKLNKRIRDLIQAQTTAFHELEEERKKAPAAPADAAAIARRPTVANFGELQRRPTIAFGDGINRAAALKERTQTIGGAQRLVPAPVASVAKAASTTSPTSTSTSSLTASGDKSVSSTSSTSTGAASSIQSNTAATSDKDKKSTGLSSTLRRLSRKVSEPRISISEPSDFKHVGSAFSKKLQENPATSTATSTPTAVSIAAPTTTDVKPALAPTTATTISGAAVTASLSVSQPVPVSTSSIKSSTDSKSESNSAAASRTSSTSSLPEQPSPSSRMAHRGTWSRDDFERNKAEMNRLKQEAKIETGRLLGSTHKSPNIQLTLPEGWEEHVDLSGKVYYLNHITECVSRKHPLSSQIRQGEGAKLVQIFTQLGQRTTSTQKFDRKHEQRANMIQRNVRRMIMRNRFIVLKDLAKLRENAIKEIVKAETAFSQSLLTITKYFQDPNVKKVKAIETVASLLQGILRTSQVLLDSFKQRAESWFFYQRVGDVFMTLVPQLELYSNYARALQDTSLSSELQKYMASTVTKGKTGAANLAIDLPSLLEVPLGHLPKYKKCVENLLKTTFRSNPDYDTLMTAYTRIKTTTDQVEESVKLRRNQDNMERLKKMFTGNVPADLLTNKDRVFIREGPLIKIESGNPKKRFLVLFNDCIVWGERDEKSPTVKYRNMLSLVGNSSVRDLPKGKQDGLENGLELVTQTRNIQLYFDNDILKKSWMDSFSSVVRSVPASLQQEPLPTDSKSRRNSTAMGVSPVASNQSTSANNTSTDSGASGGDKESSSPSANACQLCGSQFTFTKRKHNCKKCNKVVCGSCSGNKMKLPNFTSQQRVCDECWSESNVSPKPVMSARAMTIRRTKSAGTVASLYALPTLVLQRIFSFLGAKDLAAMSLVCRAWRTIIDDDNVWRRSFLRRWGAPDVVAAKTWKQRYNIEVNWEHGKHWTSSMQSHTASITALHFDESHLVSGSIDTKVLLWDLKTRKCVRVMAGHLSAVRCVSLAASQDSIYSGSDDKTVRLWSFETGKLIKTLRDNTGEVTCMQVEPEKNLLVTGSNDATIKLYDTRSWKVTQTFKSRDKVLCLQKQNDIMVSAGQDKIIRLWDVRQNLALSELKGHSEAIRCIQFDENQIVSGSDDGTVRIWDLKEGRRSMVAHKDAKVTSLQFDGNKLVTASSDSTTKVWHLESGTLLHTIESEKGSGWIRCLQFMQEVLVTGHGDNTLRYYNFYDRPKEE